MIAENQLKDLEHTIENLLNNEPGYFLVDLKIKPTNNIKVFVDADQGASIDQLTRLNRALYRQLDESGWFPNGDFSLEVSSPGLDEPLKLHRQYLKNLGRPVEIVLKNGNRIEGKLMEANGSDILVEEEKGHPKKKEILQHKLQIDDIKSTKIQIKF